MVGGIRCCAVVALALFVGGCVAPTTRQQAIDPELAAREAEKQRDLVIQDFLENSSRINSLGYRMLLAGTALCGERLKPVAGFTILSAADFEGDYYQSYRRLNRDSDQAHVVALIDGAPAAVAGLRVGDMVLAINGEPLAAEQGAADAALTELRDGANQQTITLTIRRLGEGERDIEMVTEPVCDYDLQFELNDRVNAFADGDNVIITSGMVRFAASDSQLAAVVGHEIAHNAMGHLDAKKVNAMAGAGVGLIFDILAAAAGVNTGGDFMRIGMNAGAGAYSRDFEAEADYVGLYLMARAGMAVEDVPNFWRRMAVAHPASIASNHGATHPPTPERFLALENAVAEIAAKLTAGEALMPEITVAPGPRTGGTTPGGSSVTRDTSIR